MEEHEGRKNEKRWEKAGWAFFSPDLPRALLGGWAKACAFASEFAAQTPQ
jgi:hypothetical protein